MSRNRIILVVAVTAFVLIGLFPPWLYTVSGRNFASRITANSEKDAGYHFLIFPPPPKSQQPFFGVRLDLALLGIEWLCLAVTIGATWMLVNGSNKVVGARQGRGKTANPTISASQAKHLGKRFPQSAVIADDDTGLCEIYSMILRERFPEIEILTFNDGLLAWDYLADHDPSFLIMDINRPGVDGIETLGRLSRLGKRYPIFIVSGLLSENIEELVQQIAGAMNVFLVSKAATLEMFEKTIFPALSKAEGKPDRKAMSGFLRFLSGCLDAWVRGD